MSLPPFHLAFPVDDLARARAFYGGVLGCAEGRSSDEWIDFDFFGHQLVAHLAPRPAGASAKASGGAPAEPRPNILVFVGDDLGDERSHIDRL